MMTQQPSKELVREWLQRRRAESSPPPSIEQVRRELGWKLEQGVQRCLAAVPQVSR
ncbi:hypothetical protein ACHMW6_12635 [Pseudoduganella sp. UC29_106]|uniref:hypothetical protein n=1 Tax=Pseudoduganella sp. UC29_106 TaxID=3374553 RepID=UPI003758280D